MPNINSAWSHAAGVLVSLACLGLTACESTKDSAQNQRGADNTPLFDEADTNNDGKLSLKEASNFFVDTIFVWHDANNDRRLSPKEWGVETPIRKEAFEKRDANHDGFVTKKEALAYSRTRGLAGSIFKEADKNKDGFLDRAEARAYFAGKDPAQV